MARLIMASLVPKRENNGFAWHQNGIGLGSDLALLEMHTLKEAAESVGPRPRNGFALQNQQRDHNKQNTLSLPSPRLGRSSRLHPSRRRPKAAPQGEAKLDNPHAEEAEGRLEACCKGPPT